MNREDNQLITKSNVLIQETIDDLDKRELYLMAVLLSEFKALNPDARCLNDVKQKTVTLTVTEFLNFLDLDVHSGSNQEYCKKLIIHFQNRAFFTWIDDKKYSVRTPMFRNIKIPPHWFDKTNDDYDIQFEFLEEFINFIAVDDRYTTLFKKSILSLKSTASIKLYQLLKSYSNKDWDTTISVDELRLKLGMTSKSYDRFDRFYDRGIQRSIDEINAHTEINVSAKKNKNQRDKRKVESITFKIRNADKKHSEWDMTFPNIKLTNSEYTEIKQWTSYPDWKRCCRDLQEKLDAGIDIRNHYKWIVGHHKELEKKQLKKLTQSEEPNRSNSKPSVRKLPNGERLKSTPGFDIHEIQRKAMFNDDYDV